MFSRVFPKAGSFADALPFEIESGRSACTSLFTSLRVNNGFLFFSPPINNCPSTLASFRIAMVPFFFSVNYLRLLYRCNVHDPARTLVGITFTNS